MVTFGRGDLDEPVDVETVDDRAGRRDGHEVADVHGSARCRSAPRCCRASGAGRCRPRGRAVERHAVADGRAGPDVGVRGRPIGASVSPDAA